MIISVGHKHFVQAELVKSILRPDSLSGRTSKRAAKATGMLIDATSGRKTRSVIVLKDDQVVLSALDRSALRNG